MDLHEERRRGRWEVRIEQLLPWMFFGYRQNKTADSQLPSPREQLCSPFYQRPNGPRKHEFQDGVGVLGRGDKQNENDSFAQDYHYSQDSRPETLSRKSHFRQRLCRQTFYGSLYRAQRFQEAVYP